MLERTHRRLRGAESIDWIDASRCAPQELGVDLDREAAPARLHVRRADGTLVDGAAAFATLWQRLPKLAWLGRIASQPVVLPLFNGVYFTFLRVRRLWRVPADDVPRAVPNLRTDPPVRQAQS